MKRRSLLKMLGVSPALLVPWKPATEQIATAPAPPAEPEMLTLQEAMRRVDWDKELQPPPAIMVDQSTDPFVRPLRTAHSYATTGIVGFSWGVASWADGPDWGE